MSYLLLKYIHIISSTILFGTGVGSAFYMFMANRKKNVSEIYFATRNVVIADWIFTTPAIIIQFATGMGLAHMGGFEFSETWLAWSLTLFVFAGVCWLPVVWMQIKMRDIAKHALKTKTDLPARYWKFDRWWLMLGALAFPAVMIVFYLMVVKP